MYSEIIHTRCGDGIDIKKNRIPVNGGGIGGFKVYSCTGNVTDDGFVDLLFLDKVLSEKQSYADPAFMDDAYLYYVPDIGHRILVNFHPIHFDKTARPGNYPHRPGNFINQAFIGSFEDIYPYETFGNEAVWDAHRRGEAFYYENVPTELPPRENLSDELGNIVFDDIADFVADGRRDVLKSVIAFLVSQYDSPPEERKYLVIRDEDSEQIEMWIAAIESAFSPRMASGLSFATRLDKFTNTNKYTVNLNGRYQPTINLQSPDQKLRYRAMIVGVDGRDRINAPAVRVLPNSPYAVLDGTAKMFSSPVDVSHPFYHFVTGFDNAHSYFCRAFLQTVHLFSPTSDALKLFVAYSKLESSDSPPVLRDVVDGLNILGGYHLVRTFYLESLYKTIKANLSEYLKEDASLAFVVLNWLNKTSVIVGDMVAGESFNQIVCRSFAADVFRHPQSPKTAELAKIVGASSFVQSAAEYLTSESLAAEYEEDVRAYGSADWTAFSELFTKSMGLLAGTQKALSNTARRMLSESIRTTYTEKDGNAALRIAGYYYELSPSDTLEALLFDVASVGDLGYINYVINIICRISPETISTDTNLTAFRERLRSYRLEGCFATVLAFKARRLGRVQDMEKFLDSILSDKEFKESDLSSVLAALDKNLHVADKMAGKVAAKIQNLNTGRVVYINSAHICALSAIEDKQLPKSLIHHLLAQGVPSVEDEVYANAFVKKLFSDKVSGDVFAAVVEASEKSCFYADKIVGEAFRYIGGRQGEVVGEVVAAAVRCNDGNLFHALIENCAALKQFAKGMSAIRSTLRTAEEKRYFDIIERDASVLANQKKSGSLFGKFFSRRSSDDPNSGSREKR